MFLETNVRCSARFMTAAFMALYVGRVIRFAISGLEFAMTMAEFGGCGSSRSRKKRQADAINDVIQVGCRSFAEVVWILPARELCCIPTSRTNRWACKREVVAVSFRRVDLPVVYA
ncbi:hypothetical protein LX36DRAFT_474604 [Colletotrichum falcatum]|nr:hypothetical protein LX36DRAFT_474604 [Colletotrichum falcatum]